MSALARLETDAGGTVISGRTASAGRARLGVQTTGQPMPVCEALTTFGRASARGDWGDAGTGAGLELAAGATYANRARRLHASIGIRSLATHSISGYEEYGGDVSFSFLRRPDGTGLQVALSSKHGETAAGGGNSSWLRDFDWHDGGRRPPAWRTKARLGYGSSAFGGVAQPFMERNTGRTVATLGSVCTSSAPPSRDDGLMRKLPSGTEACSETTWV